MLSFDAVKMFKERWCDENETIINIFKQNLMSDFVSPILDLGCGLGDIAYYALDKQKVVRIDINKITEGEYPLPSGHTRLEADFFDYKPVDEINTLLISHSLQFIDEDRNSLDRKIKELNPKSIIVIRNQNDDIMGSLVDWAYCNLSDANPEINLNNFPLQYSLNKTVPFTATIACPTFKVLAEQILFIMGSEHVQALGRLCDFLRSQLKEPSINFNEVIEVFNRNEKG